MSGPAFFNARSRHGIDMQALLRTYGPTRRIDTALHGPSEALRREQARAATLLSPEVPTGKLSLAHLIQWASNNAPISRTDAIALMLRHDDVGVLALSQCAKDGLLAENVLSAVLPLMWQTAGSPERMIPRSDWIAMADLADRPGVAGDRQSRQRMNPLRLFRGSMPEGTNVTTGAGMTWTTRRYRASVYAFERQSGVLYSALVHPNRILFCSTFCGPECDWTEFVIDVQGLETVIDARHDHAPSVSLWPSPRPRNPLCSCRRPPDER